MQTEKTIYALGFFDGVHLGHQALLSACQQLAAKNGCKAGALTFAVHPDGLVSGNAPTLINTIEDRASLLKTYGMESVVVLPFDQALMRTPWSDFLTRLVEDGTAGFVCGSDFRFGAGGEGTAKHLSAFCENHQLPYSVVPEQLLDGIRISSTHIRTLLASGDLENANRFLGHAHVFSGTVVTGRGLGRTIGIPTANLQITNGVLLPKTGVYACIAHVNGQNYPAVTNIGTRPTVDGHHVTIEPWLLDFDGDLYGKTLKLSFFRYLRPERKFDSLADLKAEIEKNAAQTRKIFEKQ